MNKTSLIKQFHKVSFFKKDRTWDGVGLLAHGRFFESDRGINWPLRDSLLALWLQASPSEFSSRPQDAEPCLSSRVIRKQGKDCVKSARHRISQIPWGEQMITNELKWNLGSFQDAGVLISIILIILDPCQFAQILLPWFARSSTKRNRRKISRGRQLHPSIA